jgi:TolB-like protein
MSLFSELKRRNVIRVAVAYLVASWLLLQIVDVMVPILDLPDWVGKLVFLILLIGLVPALVFSWAYEMTPDGLKPESEIEHDQSITLHTAKKLDRVTIILVLIVAGMVVLDRVIPESENETEPPSESGQITPSQAISSTTEQPVDGPLTEIKSTPDDGRTSVAVIPFVNMSDDQQNEYFSDGISEELLNVLVRIKSLRVPSRTSSFTFKNSNKNITEIASALKVDHVLEGSVRKAGNRIRVTAQLIEAKTDTHLWSETYTRDLDDIFAVQDEIAQAIVKALQLTLSGEDNQTLGTHSTRNVEAYNKYLLGRYFWNQRTAQSLHSAATELRKAIEIDPEFDQAWAALADVYVLIPEYRGGSIDEYIPLARAAVEKALAINPDSARALTTSGYYKATFDYDWEGANSDYERAIQLEPGYATAHQWYGEALNQQGRLEEALLQLQMARNADPLSVVVRHVPGYFLLWAYRLDEAEVCFMDALELGEPLLRWTINNLDMLYTFRGDFDKARQKANQLAIMEGFDPSADLARIDAIENPALKAHALTLLEQRQDLADGVFGKALHYAMLDEYELSLENLETAFVAGDPFAVHMNYMKIYEPLRGRPRFQDMLKQMNLLP